MPRKKGESDRGGAGAQPRARPEDEEGAERQREQPGPTEDAERRRLQDALENERQRLTRK